MSDTQTIQLTSLDNLPEVNQKTSVILPDGREGFIYPDSSIRRPDGSYLVRPSWSNPAFTGDTGREAVKIREAVRREAVVNAILSGTNKKDLGLGIQALAEELVKIVKKGSQDRDKITAFKELMRHGGLAYDLGRGSGDPVGGSGPSGLSSEAVSALNIILPALERRLREASGGDFA